MRIYLLVALVTLAGCAKVPATDDVGGVCVSDGAGAGCVYRITLSDGTRCAALVGHYKGALSCDWSRR